MQENETAPATTVRPAYRWPYFLGAFVLLGMVLAVMWTLWGVNQTREQREDRKNRDAFGNPVNTNQTNK